MMRKKERLISLEEVQKHNTPTDCWLVIEDQVYDVSKWALLHHPGGPIIVRFAGRDATELFLVNHNSFDRSIQAKLRAFQIGVLHPATDNCERDLGRLPEKMAFRELIRTVREKGFYETSWTYYLTKMLIVFGSMALCFCITLIANDKTVDDGQPQLLHRGSALIAGLLLALSWHQSAFLAHDCLHNGVTHNVQLDSWLGFLFGTLILGIPSKWWKDNHHLHHALTNLVENKSEFLPLEKPGHINGPSKWFGDPQMIYTPIWYTDPKLFQLFPVTQHRKQSSDEVSGQPQRQREQKIQHKSKNGFFLGELPWRWWIVQIQHLTFLPLHLLIGRWNIYVLAIQNCFFMNSPSESVGLSFFFFWLYYLSSFWIQSDIDSGDRWCALLIFVLVSHTLVGMMHLQLNLTHFGQPMLSRDEMDTVGYVRSQLLTSRNLNSNWWNEWFHGGLDFQNEHHLFPMLPRHSLKAVKPLVKSFCETYGIEYQSCGFFEAIRIILKDLKRISQDPLADF